MKCSICGHTEGERYSVREMMIGTRETFRYFLCNHCQALQTIEPPEDLSPYYPSDLYYAYDNPDHDSPSNSGLRIRVKRWRDAAILFERNGFVSSRFKQRFPNPGIEDVRGWLRNLDWPSYQTRILDVGCGAGHLLHRLANLGFSQLYGVDPYLEKSSTAGPVRIFAEPMPSLIGQQFDLVMLHHSMEHMPDQTAAIEVIAKLLAPGGVCLVRMPIVSRGPWQRYGVDWAEIDAPRHFVIHSELSFHLLCQAAGLVISHIDYEADPFFYRTSELYRRDIPLRSTEAESAFTDEEEAEFCRLADQYNVPGWAGRAAFHLRHASETIPSHRTAVLKDFP